MKPFQPFFRYMICEEGFENIRVNGKNMGFSLEIRFPSYRGTPLSCLEDLRIKIDSEPIEAEKVMDAFFKSSETGTDLHLLKQQNIKDLNNQ